MKGCHEDDDDGSAGSGGSADDDCNSYEQRRIQENYVQPMWIKQNHHNHYYTTLGYTTRRIPSESYKVLSRFFTTNAAGPSFLPYHHQHDDNTKMKVLSLGIWNEFWSAGYTYWNHWIRSGSNNNNNHNDNENKGSSIVDIGRTDLTYRFHPNHYATLIDGVRNAVEEWTSTTVVLQASYGIRIYREGTIVAPHVDKLPFVLTAMLHIDDNLLNDDDEPWIYELIGHDGLAHNVTTKKGEMLLYEGASVIHGRPYPMKRNSNGAVPSYMACLYMHFEPIGYTAGIHRSHNNNGQDQGHDQKKGNIHIMGSMTTKEIDLASKELFELTLKQQQQQQHQQQDTAAKQQQSTSPRAVPRYVWPEYVDTYTQKSFYYKFEEKIYPKPTKLVFGSITAHQAASLGDLKALKEMAKTTDRTELFKADINGWRPIHEAARSGYADILEFLLEEGAQVNQRTNDGLGGNALYWAEKDPVKNEKAIAVLKKYGAVNLPPLTDAQRREKRQRDEEELQQQRKKQQQQQQQQQQQTKDNNNNNNIVIVQA
jgi:prolyl 4-hydroxylase